MMDNMALPANGGREKKLVLSCPVCGAYLLKTADTEGIELVCRKCRSELCCKVRGGEISIHIMHWSPKQKKIA